MSKLKCYNCGKKGHFARDYKEHKKVNNLYALISAINVSSYVFFLLNIISFVDFRLKSHRPFSEG